MSKPKFTLRPGYKNSAGESPVILTYRAKGEKDFMRKTTGIFCKKDFLLHNVISDPGLHFNIRKERQEVLDVMMKRVKKIIRYFEEEEGILYPEWRRVEQQYEKLYNPKAENERITVPALLVVKKLTPMESFQKFIDDSANGVRRTKKGGKLAKDTLKNYRSTNYILKKFIAHTKYDLSNWENINYEFYCRFTDYCFDVLGHFDNNVGKYVKQLRAWLTWALEEGIIDKKPYNSKWIVWKEESVDSLVLYPDELKVTGRLAEKKFAGIPNGIRTRDLFVVGCLTCVRVSDLDKLVTEFLHKFNGAYYLRYSDNKTNGEAGTEIAPVGARIIDKYMATGEGLPKISDVQLNRDLKIFGRFLKRYFIKHREELVKEGLVLQDWESPFRKQRRRRGEVVIVEDVDRDQFTSHLMRRTGITSLAIAGLTKDEIKKVSGHKSDKELDKYIKVADRFRNTNIKKAWEAIMG